MPRSLVALTLFGSAIVAAVCGVTLEVVAFRDGMGGEFDRVARARYLKRVEASGFLKTAALVCVVAGTIVSLLCKTQPGGTPGPTDAPHTPC